MFFIIATIIGGVLFCALTAYAACVVSGMCAEDEYRKWLEEINEEGKWD